MEYIYHYASPLGGITAASDGKALNGLWFDGQRYFADTLDWEHEERELSIFAETGRWLELYFSGKNPGFTPELSLKTTVFCRRIQELLLSVPYGQTVTYGEIAARAAGKMGRGRMSARAVGAAVGHNSISIIIPCHRVVGKSSIGGYAGGIQRKAFLLELEGAWKEYGTEGIFGSGYEKRNSRGKGKNL